MSDYSVHNNSASSGGISFLGLLTIVFIVLKLTNYISWSWWWVLAPIWAGPLAVFSVVLVFAFILALMKK